MKLDAELAQRLHDRIPLSQARPLGRNIPMNGTHYGVEIEESYANILNYGGVGGCVEMILGLEEFAAPWYSEKAVRKRQDERTLRARSSI